MKKVLLLLANGFEFYEASVFIDVFGWNLIEGKGATKLFTCGLNKVVDSSFDQKMIVDHQIEEISVNEFAALAIPGGFEEFGFYKDAFSDRFLSLIRMFDSQNKMIASICTGALPIAKSGVLLGRRATTYHLSPIRQTMLKDLGANLVQEPVVLDRNIITCWNPSTSIEVAFTLLECLTSTSNSKFIKNLMGFK